MAVERILAIGGTATTFLALVLVPFGLRLLDSYIKRRDEEQPDVVLRGLPVQEDPRVELVRLLKEALAEEKAERAQERRENRAAISRVTCERNAAWDRLDELGEKRPLVYRQYHPNDIDPDAGGENV